MIDTSQGTALRLGRSSRTTSPRCIPLSELCGVLLLAMSASSAVPASTASMGTQFQVQSGGASGTRNSQVTATTYGGRAAFRLSDGRTEAIVVPAIGRVMRYGFIGGPNLLWNTPQSRFKAGEWNNWGGDKTWPAPQSHWPVLSGRAWPPDEAWDGSAHTPQVLSGGRLRTSSALSPGPGARIVREYGFNASGEFEINQIVEKTRGAPMMLSVWSITQIVPPEAVFLPLNERSVYKDNVFWFGGKPNEKVTVVPVLPSLLLLVPARTAFGSGNYKIGADAPIAAIAAVTDGVAFVQKTARPDGQYPDGAADAGFPVELYDSGDAHGPAHYLELELLSPLRPFRAGTRWAHTVRWSLHRLASRHVIATATHDEIQRLLSAPPTSSKAQSPTNETRPVVQNEPPASPWETEIRAFEEAERKNPSPPGAVLFVGSSSIRGWETLARDFPGVPVINRGFGGSHLSDSVRFAGRIVLPPKPRLVVVYAGDNDLAEGKTPQQILSDWKALAQKIHAALPQTRLAFISIKPSPARRHLLEAMRETNRLIAADIRSHEWMSYIDVFTPMLDETGAPRATLFGGDSLHMNRTGYTLWAEVVRPHL